MLAVGTAGATSEWRTSHQVELTCIKRKQLQHVGYIVYNVGQRLCNVVAVTGRRKPELAAMSGPPNNSFKPNPLRGSA